MESRYKKAFAKSLSLDEAKIDDKLKYNDIPEWDSIGHMTLISELDSEFEISMETYDIIDFSSYKKGKEILKKYKIEIN